jgi:hypothetical protein
MSYPFFPSSCFCIFSLSSLSASQCALGSVCRGFRLLWRWGPQICRRSKGGPCSARKEAGVGVAVKRANGAQIGPVLPAQAAALSPSSLWPAGTRPPPVPSRLRPSRMPPALRRAAGLPPGFPLHCRPRRRVDPAFAASSRTRAPSRSRTRAGHARPPSLPFFPALAAAPIPQPAAGRRPSGLARGRAGEARRPSRAARRRPAVQSRARRQRSHWLGAVTPRGAAAAASADWRAGGRVRAARAAPKPLHLGVAPPPPRAGPTPPPPPPPCPCFVDAASGAAASPSPGCPGPKKGRERRAPRSGARTDSRPPPHSAAFRAFGTAPLPACSHLHIPRLWPISERLSRSGWLLP